MTVRVDLVEGDSAASRLAGIVPISGGFRRPVIIFAKTAVQACLTLYWLISPGWLWAEFSKV